MPVHFIVPKQPCKYVPGLTTETHMRAVQLGLCSSNMHSHEKAQTINLCAHRVGRLARIPPQFRSPLVDSCVGTSDRIRSVSLGSPLLA